MFIPGERPEQPHDARVSWTIRDAVAGILALVLLTLSLILAAGGFLLLADDGLSGEAFLSILGAAGAFLPAIVIARFAAASQSWLSRIALGAILLTAVAISISSGTGEDRELFGLPIELVIQTAAVLMQFAVVVAFAVQRRGGSWSALGFVPSIHPTRTIGAFGVWFIGLVLIGASTWLFEQLGVDIPTPPDNATEALDSFGRLLVPSIVLVVFLGPVVEEMVFRGFLLGALRSRFGPVASIILSAAVFALFHVEPGLYLPIFILGLSLGTVRVWTGSLWPAIMVHMTQNALALMVAYNGIDV